jgi:predicted AlkP superfamily phosphohydrolase/phosphomutase
MERTVVIGIDGADWRILRDLIERDLLPNIESLCSDGAVGQLNSIVPPVSPPAWNSIHTGCNPGKHGVFDFMTFDERHRMRTIDATDRRVTPFWELLNENEVSTGLFKIPFTHPPSPVDGFLVTGFPTPSRAEQFTFPHGLRNRLPSPSDLFEDYSYQNNKNYNQFKENLLSVARRQTDEFCSLLNEFDTDFLMTVYDGADRVQHFFWKYHDESHPRYRQDASLSDAITRYYQTVDEGIGRTLGKLSEETNVVIISDHGFGPLVKDIYIEKWLANEGYLSVSRTAGAKTRLVDALVTPLWNGIKRVGIDERVRRIIPEDLFATARKATDRTKGRIEWMDSDTFFSTSSGQSLFINTEERFVDGSVTGREYDRVVKNLTQDLKQLRDPETGDRVVKEVYHRDEVFSGGAVTDAPDLIVKTRGEYRLKGGQSDKVVDQATQRGSELSGDHRTSGVFIGAGPAFRNASGIEASIMDIAPTILYLYGCAIPRRIDGEVRTDILVDELTDGRAPRYTNDLRSSSESGSQWSDEQREELEDQLEDMGYL